MTGPALAGPAGFRYGWQPCCCRYPDSGAYNHWSMCQPVPGVVVKTILSFAEVPVPLAIPIAAPLKYFFVNPPDTSFQMLTAKLACGGCLEFKTRPLIAIGRILGFAGDHPQFAPSGGRQSEREVERPGVAIGEGCSQIVCDVLPVPHRRRNGGIASAVGVHLPGGSATAFPPIVAVLGVQGAIDIVFGRSEMDDCGWRRQWRRRNRRGHCRCGQR